MQVVQFEIEDQLIHAIGMQSIKVFLDRQIALLRLNFLGGKISQVIQESGIDHNKEINEARQEAWQKYKDGMNQLVDSIATNHKSAPSIRNNFAFGMWSDLQEDSRELLNQIRKNQWTRL